MSVRLERVRQVLKSEISEIIQNRLRDPRIGFVTVTDVTVSKDLRHAKVFVSVYGDSDERERTLEGLRSARDFVRGEIGHRVRLKFTPEVDFQFDPGIARGARVFKLLGQLNSNENEEGKSENPEADSGIL